VSLFIHDLFSKHDDIKDCNFSKKNNIDSEI